MSAVYRMEEIVATSTDSYEHAIRTAVEKVSSASDESTWFEVVEMRGAVREGKVAEFQVKVRVGCKV